MENIPKNITDELYPYKRSKIDIIQKHRSIIWTNFGLICNQIYTNDENLCKFLKQFLHKNGCIINESLEIGTVTINELDNALEVYIRNYVLCNICYLPNFACNC